MRNLARAPGARDGGGPWIMLHTPRLAGQLRGASPGCAGCPQKHVKMLLHGGYYSME